MTPDQLSVFATEAHRGRGIVHLARALDVTDDRRLRLRTSALCGASTASAIHRGRRIPTTLRPGESIALKPTCRTCLKFDYPHPTPGDIVPRHLLGESAR